MHLSDTKVYAFLICHMASFCPLLELDIQITKHFYVIIIFKTFRWVTGAQGCSPSFFIQDEAVALPLTQGPYLPTTSFTQLMIPCGPSLTFPAQTSLASLQ